MGKLSLPCGKRNDVCYTRQREDKTIFFKICEGDLTKVPCDYTVQDTKLLVSRSHGVLVDFFSISECFTVSLFTNRLKSFIYRKHLKNCTEKISV